METITINKHKLVVGTSFLVTFLIGLCLGMAIGVHANHHDNRMYGTRMMHGYGEWGGEQGQKVMIMKKMVPNQDVILEPTTTEQ